MNLAIAVMGNVSASSVVSNDAKQVLLIESSIFAVALTMIAIFEYFERDTVVGTLATHTIQKNCFHARAKAIDRADLRVIQMMFISSDANNANAVKCMCNDYPIKMEKILAASKLEYVRDFFE
jgi:hypothetical protein